MTTELSPLQHLMRLLTVEEQEQLALLAGTSREYLYQLGSGHRRASAEMAGRLERAAGIVRSRSPRSEMLPVLPRTALSETCRECQYARACVGDTIATAMPVVDPAAPQRALRDADHDAASDDNA